MRIASRYHMALAAAVLFAAASTQLAAQGNGAATYKAKCQMCHGATGLADSGPGKAMKVKPITDPDVKKLSEAEMIKSVTNGQGKMKAYKDTLTAAEIKDSVAYFRTFLK